MVLTAASIIAVREVKAIQFNCCFFNTNTIFAVFQDFLSGSIMVSLEGGFLFIYSMGFSPFQICGVVLHLPGSNY